MDTIRITTLNEARRFMVDCFEASGTCKAHAEIAAENLLEADYRGHFSHGMIRLTCYTSDILSGILDPNAIPRVEKETVATALVNGNNGLGSVVGKYCMDLAIKKAKEVGIALVTAHQSNHYGIAGMYALQAIKEGCIGLSVTNTSPAMVPTRAKKAALGADPIAFGAPGRNNDNLVVDMATTVVALGKVEIYRCKGERLPEGWAINQLGETETDPEKAIKSKMLLPLGGEESTGGYKGYGLAMMVQVLSGILSGSNFGPNIPAWTSKGCREKANLGQAFLAIDPSVFAPGYQDRLSTLMDYIRQMEPKDQDRPVLIPGDPENIHMKYVDEQGGLCYVDDQYKTNNDLARKLNILPMKFIEKPQFKTN